MGICATIAWQVGPKLEEWPTVVFLASQGLGLVIAVFWMRRTINSLDSNVRASLKMIIFHFVNFIGLEALHFIRYAHRRINCPCPEWSPHGRVNYRNLIDMIIECYATYMILVLFYLVYQFGKNRQIGKMVYEENLTDDSEQTSEEDR